MTKSERLFNLVTLLSSRRTAITAESIADVMEVSVRTVYRDIQSLQSANISIEGEPGVGYLLGKRNHLPPLMFKTQEALALLLGSKMVQAFTDPQLAKSAQSAEEKILSVLPERQKISLEQQPYRIPLLDSDNHFRNTHLILRQACENKLKVKALYKDGRDRTTERILWPLGVIGWFGKWTLLAYCELRQSYRNFRFDRFAQIDVLEEEFFASEECSLEHYLASIPKDC
ncbi:MAG: WYL domain-containing protein [Alteromonadaceae bacterium]|nr:WYL domain-containing protein [Alteromonadaceae bacterium]